MLARFNRRMSGACDALAAAGALVLAVLVTVTVFMRFVVGAPPHWAEELPRLILVWSALVGAVVCSRRRTHLSAGITPLLVRDPVYRNYIDRFNNLALLAMLCLLGKAGWDLSQITMGQTTTALQMPAGLLYLAVPISCAAMALVHLELLVAPGTAEPVTPEPATPQLGTPKPGTPQPGTPQPGTPQPGTPQSGTPRPGARRSGTLEPDVPDDDTRT